MEQEHFGPLEIIRSSEVPPEILGVTLGKEIQERLVALRPALIPWEVTEEHTAFLLDHRQDLTGVLSFVQEGVEQEERKRELPSTVQWYLQELRRDLREIVESGALRRGGGSRFAIDNRPVASSPIDPKNWHPETLAFVEEVRPKLAEVIKERSIDHWLQTSIDILGGQSPLQVIESGGGDRILALAEEMRQS